MKRKILNAFCIFIFGITFGQEFTSEIVSSTGDNFLNGQNQLCWTIGEPITETIISNDYVLTQGFHQNNLEMNTIDKVIFEDLKVTIFPNPTIDIIYISFQNNKFQELTLKLIDSNGKQILNQRLTDFKKIEQINLTGLPAELYILNISNKEQDYSFRLIKKN
jgi:hypothetical protein